jgi:hypothetical protein
VHFVLNPVKQKPEELQESVQAEETNPEKPSGPFLGLIVMSH